MKIASQHKRWAGLLLVPLLLAAGFAVGELAGWPWLAGSLERSLGERLGRTVELVAVPGGQRLHLRLLGGVNVAVDRLRIGGPNWRPEINTLDAAGIKLRLRYRDLWAWQRGANTLRIKELSAQSLEADLMRLDDGRATWTVVPSKAANEDKSAVPKPLLSFDRLLLNEAHLSVDDRPLKLKAHIKALLSEAPAPSRPAGLGVSARAEGSYRGRPLKASLETGSPLPWLGVGEAQAVPISLRLEAGRAKLAFDGSTIDLLGLQGLAGKLQLSGPSLAAIGDPLGLTLPSTAAFELQGQLRHRDGLWHADIEQALLGRSRLDGSFDFKSGPGRPLLSGRLGGSTLWFADLAPMIGAANADLPGPPKGRLLPDRQFDLPSLRAMDANVELALRRVDLGSHFAVPITPVHARLRLVDGVLTIADIDARSARGRIGGELSLDGRADIALWQARLQWSGLRLEEWIKQGRRPGQPPYISGMLDGRLALDGRGRSTAELLASANGRVQLRLPGGTISHLAVEAAGIDLAQGLGILLRGDDALPLQCAAADLRVAKGQIVPTAMVIDTRDSTLWVEGRVALDTEKIDLRLQVAPKDVSPLSLRTPILITGSLADPDWALERRPLALKLVPAMLLAALNPLAGLLPLIDTGAGKDLTGPEQDLLRACRRLGSKRL